MDKKLAFIGCGNIASAMIRGVVGSGVVAAENVMAADPCGERPQKLAQELGIRPETNNRKAVDFADIVFLCVEPAHSPEVCRQIRSDLKRKQIVISVAAGVSVASLKEWLEDFDRVVRVMPNIPISVGAGMCMICETEDISREELAEVVKIFESFGAVEVLEEKHINAFISIAGSSPSYIFMLIEAMADGGVLLGLTRNVAYKLAAQSVLGSAKMVLDTGAHPGVLKDMVTSPGGTTIEAVAALEKCGLRSSMIEAVRACYEKCETMAAKK